MSSLIGMKSIVRRPDDECHFTRLVRCCKHLKLQETEIQSIVDRPPE